MKSHTIVSHSEGTKGVLDNCCNIWILLIEFKDYCSFYLPDSIDLLNNLDIEDPVEKGYVVAWIKTMP
jgi:hypothetical protein